MNIAIVYYSYSGNTHMAANVIAELLKEQGHELKPLRIEAPHEANNFFLQILRALTLRRTEIAPIATDLSAYDLIIFGTPVWAAEITPALRTFLRKTRGLLRKNALIFVTYGSGFGKDHCLDSLERSLLELGVTHISRFSLPQSRTTDKFLIANLLGLSLEEITGVEKQK